MPIFSLTSKGNVVQCGSNCQCKHEHFVGSYEGALKYFGVSDPQSWGKLMNVILYHQTSDRTFPKLSNELYDILVKAQAEHKYYAPQEQRSQNALDTIEEAEKHGLIYDERLLKILERSDRQASRDRVYWFKKWEKSF